MAKPKNVKWLCAFGFHFWKKTQEKMHMNNKTKYICRRGCGCYGSF